jgi:hypothetical protein
VLPSFAGTGFGGCDLRLGLDGEFYLPAMRPSCPVFGAAALPAVADWVLGRQPTGHQGLLDLLLRSAQRRRRPPAPSRSRGVR